MPVFNLRLAIMLFLAVAALALIACGDDDDDDDTGSTSTGNGAASPTASSGGGASPTEAPSSGAAEIADCAPDGASSMTGAGATFPFPLYSKWFDEYASLCDAEINYQSIGSGGGIQQITEQTVDFGGSDGIMSDEAEAAAAAAGGPIMHIATTAGAVVPVYNLAGIGSLEITLDGETLANIFLGNITNWNDDAIAALNPNVGLPDAEIAVAHRSDGSGTSFIFTNYLTKVSADWEAGPNFGTSVEWPTGIGAQGNEGVAGQVAQIPGAIGYVELAYAVQNDLSQALMINSSGNPIEASLEATSLASDAPIPDDMKLVITDSENPDAWPISGFTWVLAYVEQEDTAKGQTLAHFLWWAIHDGQQFAAELDYAPLGGEAVAAAEAQIRRLTCGGSPCLQE
jgi:phosphate transport system substrate-binding protein